MSFYNKSTNFAVKDSLTTGDPNKIVSGVEIDTEFTNIASAFSSVDAALDFSASDIDYSNTSSGFTATNIQSAFDETVGRLRNETYAVKQSTQTVTSTNKNFFEITDFTPGLSITIPPERSDAEIEIDVHLSFSGQHFTENDAGWEFALTDNQQTGGSTTITAISRATYEYESTGASDGRNTLSGTAHLRTRLSPGEGVHQFKLFSRNAQQSGTVTLSIQGSSSEQNSTVLIRELI